FCVPWLQERGWRVHTAFADTGGVDADEREFIEQRAAELGVASHVTVDGGPAIWYGFVMPFVRAGVGDQARSPLLVSARHLLAAELGVASHVTVDGGRAIWTGFVKPFVWAGEGYQGQYPLLVSDRYLIVDAALARAAELGTNAIAHGCPGMGNDQVRFDLAVKAQGD